MKPIQVQGAPAIYQCFEGVLELLPEKIAEQQFSQGLVIHGEKSWKAVQPHFVEPGVPLHYIGYNKDCTHEEVNRISLAAASSKADFIIGIGGGKVLDIAKAAGHKSDLPVILIPTLASNCAAWTPLSVFYDDKGNFLEYIIFPRSTLMVLLDPSILIDSPPEFLRAGIGDTIAKWYEADVLTRRLSSKSVSLDIALQAARLCRDVLLEEGTKAMESLKTGSVTTHLVRAAETIIMAGGMVGGFGDHYGRISGAHSIHNGLTHLPETHRYLHGDKVAYGILVQLALEQRPEEIALLLPHYRELGLPKCLAELGITSGKQEAMGTIAEAAAAPGESIYLMDISGKEEVYAGIAQLEHLMQQET
ncbi:iron-containing alcohol dehydrogenase family protein [Sediminibacillus albus]|uniref:Uncharacterized oxidoreductase n=1 Tax=Sediminibacillus albus TaxID=407036 RepID=A0A1G9AS66_9BACI|nr:iron-containing alcohol dehydrogenase family protein [Sediminibacillus albus]SDK29480.1 uncharacterized oxidoreductase [Sediminibacillus albus]